MNGQSGNKSTDMLDEADIGSGEREPGQQDTDKIIEQIGRDRRDRQQKESGAGRDNEKANP